MDSRADGAEEVDSDGSSSPSGARSPVLDRNPSPPPDSGCGAQDGDQDQDQDAIGDTVYSKHWLFSTLTRLIHIVSEHSEEEAEGPLQLSEDDEEDLCRVWDMAMDKDVAGFLEEFKATDILLGVIAKSRCPRLTEICVGILGNVACFPDTCRTLSQNEDLGVVLLLLLADADPPTLLETCRLLLGCLSQRDVSSLWLQRVQQQDSVRSSLCFIMRSSTNTELLEKVGELLDKLFDLDEELMKSWVSARPREEQEEQEEQEESLDMVLCLLEAAKQLRSESPAGLEVYLHALHLLTTVDEGLEAYASPRGPGRAVWDFVCAVVCEDVCQTALDLQEQKHVLLQTLELLQALHRCQDHWTSRPQTSVVLVAALLRVLHLLSEIKDEDEQLHALAAVCTELLAHIVLQVPQETVVELVKDGHLTEETALTAVSRLLPSFQASAEHLQAALRRTHPRLADVLSDRFPV